MSSTRPRSSDRGFTLLECQVALLGLTLAVLFLSRMISSHDVLLQDMDGWLQGDDPTWYVVPREDDYERWLEVEADLSTTPGTGGGGGGGGQGKGKGKCQGGGGGGTYTVTVLSTDGTLDPPTLSIVVNLRNN